MDKTLITAAMIETFTACRRAYKLAFSATNLERIEGSNSSSICKRFLLKALADVNRGRLTSVSHIQKFMGQHWPVDKLKADEAVRTFLFAYKALTHYVNHPYKPDGSQVAGVGLKVRARIPHERVYIEDTFDLILWHPKERKLEFVDYHLHPLKSINPAWPSPSILVKQFLAERLQSRWPFEKLCLTFVKVGPHSITPTTFTLDESLYRLHWPHLLSVLQEMKNLEHNNAQCNPLCKRCQFIEQSLAKDCPPEATELSRTA